MQSPVNLSYARSYLNHIQSDGPDQLDAAWQRMEEGSAWANGHPAYFSYLPRLLDAATSKAQLAYIAETTHGILAKVIRAYLEDPSYRGQFRLDPRVQKLILMPNACPDIFPYGRFDCFFDESTGRARFVEFNADCSSGMNKTRESLRADEASEPYQQLAAAYQLESDVPGLFEGWVDDFLDLYAQARANADEELFQPNAPARPELERWAAYRKTQRESAEPVPAPGAATPTVAIAVLLDNDDVPLGELEEYARIFGERGCQASVCDVRALAYDAETGRLSCDSPLVGEPLASIDAVWRFCIVVDLLQHWDECQPFLTAMGTGRIPLIGSFATQLVHDKQLFALLRGEATQALLTEEERAFVQKSVPFTAFIDDPALDIAEVKARPQHWVIKPTDWYDNIGVYVGPSFAERGMAGLREWVRTVDECQSAPGPSPYLVQEFCDIQTTLVVPVYGPLGTPTPAEGPDDAPLSSTDACVPASEGAPGTATSPLATREYGCLTGTYVHRGKFRGLYNRLGPGTLVTDDTVCIVSPTLWVSPLEA